MGGITMAMWDQYQNQNNRGFGDYYAKMGLPYPGATDQNMQWDSNRSPFGPGPGMQDSLLPGRGGLDKGESRGGSFNQSVQNATPWDPQQGFIYDTFNEAKGLYGQPLGHFGNTTADQSQLTQMNQMQAMGLGSQFGQQGQLGYMNNVMSGQYLDQRSNPALRGLAEQGAADITRQYQTAIAPSVYRPGSVGSGSEANRMQAANIGLGDALQRNFSSIYGQNYSQERGYQQQMPGIYQGFGAGNRANLGLMGDIGQTQGGYMQFQRQGEVDRFNYMRDEPTNRFNQYQQGILGAGAFGNMSYSQGQEQNFSRQPKPQGGGTSTGQWAGLGIGAASLFMSTRSLKTKIDEVDPLAVLDAVRKLPIDIWKYKEVVSDETGDRAPHIGPYAEDFKQILGLGDGRTIAFIDIIGFSLAAVQGAAIRIEALEARVQALETLLAPPKAVEFEEVA